MTTPAAQTPPGWYTDPHLVGQQRWWDGASWTDHVSSGGQAPMIAPPLTAPVGTAWNTLWIWLIVFVPLVSLIPLFTIDWAAYVTGLMTAIGSAASAGTTSPAAILAAELGIFQSPGYLLAALLSWAAYVATVVFAWRDHKVLTSRSVPKPFHWAWSFLSGTVYVIGRTVVVHRRTGKGVPPIWGLVAVFVLSIGYSIYLLVVINNAIYAAVPTLIH